MHGDDAEVALWIVMSEYLRQIIEYFRIGMLGFANVGNQVIGRRVVKGVVDIYQARRVQHNVECEENVVYSKHSSYVGKDVP